MSRKMGAYQFIVKSIRNTLYEHHQLDASPSIKILMELNFAIFFHIVSSVTAFVAYSCRLCTSRIYCCIFLYNAHHN